MMTKKECSDPSRLAYYLREYNEWRMGEGKYGWNEDPSKNVPLPLTPKELTMVIEGAISKLRELGKK